jgi:hypothetical protein
MPNTDHSMATGIYSVLSNAANFFNSVNKNNDSKARPTFEHHVDE